MSKDITHITKKAVQFKKAPEAVTLSYSALKIEFAKYCAEVLRFRKSMRCTTSGLVIPVYGKNSITHKR